MTLLNELLNALKAEISSKELQKLPDSLVERIKKTVEELLNTSREAKGLSSELTKAEVERIRTLARELFNVRRDKILRHVAEGIVLDKSLLTEFEAKFYDSLLKIDEERLNDLNALLLVEKIIEDQKRILVRFLKDIPSFVGIDLRTYGPFRAEDVALIPAPNAEALIKHGVAVELKR
ncbi:MAG: hypothetical protein DRJ33_00715 [Candidatus Methanomethylicota archaeon]|uniref:Gins51 C-terminal domain-containing protein n=1 Tax=Thermoproteota archaeon TaxID=2056631 RepID=A0A497F3U1_9CREN|nr:MAG: hypothetical protein DRJ33_00715 [Candidatus Verstraetearchaeota archaeon]